MVLFYLMIIIDDNKNTVFLLFAFDLWKKKKKICYYGIFLLLRINMVFMAWNSWKNLKIIVIIYCNYLEVIFRKIYFLIGFCQLDWISNIDKIVNFGKTCIFL